MSLGNSQEIFERMKDFNGGKNWTDGEKTRTDGAAWSPAGDSFQVIPDYWLLHVSPPSELGLCTETSPKYHMETLPLPMLLIKGCFFYAWPPQADHSRLLWNLPESSYSHLEHGTSTGSKGGTIWPCVTTHVILISKATPAPFPCTYCSKDENCFKGLNAIVWHMNMNELASMARLAFISLKWTTGWITRNEATLHGNLWLAPSYFVILL